ncbi:hypothetical protein ACWDX6_20985 [Streptomyces sp. NPDC003027]
MRRPHRSTRRRGRLAVVAGIVVVLLAPSGAGAVEADPGALTAVTSAAELSKLELAERRVSASTVAELDARLPNVGVDTVLRSANHRMRTPSSDPACHAAETAALPKAPTAASAYCWAEGDAYTQRWLPQGITAWRGTATN